jgi:catechol 2,3-dioxygenase-like lactoylglutathione lyase family enzyme
METTMDDSSAAFPSIGHIAISVADLDASTSWYTNLFGSQPVLDEDTGPFRHVVYAIGNGMMFGLHAFPEGSSGTFDVHHPGLDHVAFDVADRDQLTDCAKRLDSLNISHGDIVDAPYGSGLSFKDPDGIALEFFAPPA